MPFLTRDDKDAGHFKRALFHHSYKDAANKARLDCRGRSIADTQSCIDPFFHYPTIQELIARFSHTSKNYVFDAQEEFVEEPELDLPPHGLSPYEETPSGLSLNALQRAVQKRKAKKAATPPAPSPAEPEPSVDGDLAQ